MKRFLLHWPWRAAALAGALLFPSWAFAAINCSLSAQGAAGIAYDPLALAATDTTASVSLSCTRLTSDPATLSWSLGADNGLFAGGQQRNARIAGGTGQIAYDLHRNASYTAVWRDGTSTRITGTLAFGSATTASTSIPFYLRIAARQTASFGAYADTVTLRFYNGTGGGATQIATANLGIGINVPATCSISSAPGTVALAYTSFQTSASTATTSFAVTCTSGAPYTMSLDQTTGTLLGLTYSLAIAPAGSRLGSGTAQSATITGTIPGGQSGTCALGSCIATETRVLTITY